jgi:ribonuclease E
LIAREEPEAAKTQNVGAPTFGEQADYGQEEQYSEAEGPHGEFVEVEIVHEDEIVSSQDDDEGTIIEGELADDGSRPTDEERPRRRRRRRGGRRGKRGRREDGSRQDERDSAREEGDASIGDDSETAGAAIDDLHEVVDAESQSGDEPTAAELADREERKGRRRRRRRGGRTEKRGSKDDPRSATESDLDNAGDDDDEVVDEDHRSPMPAHADDSGDLDDDGLSNGSDKNSHRAIPSWEEAIGVMIATNMEARAKSPQDRPQRGRPRRGRGQGRGGRQ